MTQEDKEILLKDLCARLPYRVKIEGYELPCIILDSDWLHFMYTHKEFAIRRPYLRPMSSMTEEEVDKLFSILNINEENETEWLKVNNTNVIRLFTQEGKDFYEIAEAMDYLYSIHIDFRGLIERGLAIEAPEGMYK